jgi:ubiquinone/menaquinone biosynthesis C-methylase UbiE
LPVGGSERYALNGHDICGLLNMSFSTFFSEQARKPTGIFGRMVMSIVFDRGNAFLNGFVYDLMSIQENDRVIEIGFGTGKLISKMAENIDNGFIEGVDFSNKMVSIAQKRNKNNIADGKVKIVEGNIDEMAYEKDSFTKACSVNTIYFWSRPERTASKIAEILIPDGKLILAFEDIEQLKQRKLNQEVFSLYTKDEVRNLLVDAGFSRNVSIVSRKKGESLFHCVVAIK